MNVTMNLVGAKELRRYLEKWHKDRAKRIAGEAYASALEVQKIAKERLRGKHGGTRAWDTGNLANTTIVDRTDDKRNAEIGSTAPYAPYVEFGTIKMAARPYLFPAYLMVVDKFMNRLKEILRK